MGLTVVSCANGKLRFMSATTLLGTGLSSTPLQMFYLGMNEPCPSCLTKTRRDMV